ncbi:hypothetical protein IVB45_07955 [Bradyrhizobium sp. 4]|uniref:hypothetical protein n=1 Tax=unclassified Bradyrhizobium TaxID=2631580 RepID=UPI001FFC0FDA|nr:MULTISPECIES: hypothetical protein [unclassified Bradyrhizobium]MCK1397420.1 hypothetical protein [Bradyrhizobium sp. 39]MCK1752541.1 hypothetical protein [Bradyrhizobium sp. 135]UPJ36759.1 hypothetical protein IVB45_07955 [Bradyrhizobium sp. 4]
MKAEIIDAAIKVCLAGNPCQAEGGQEDCQRGTSVRRGGCGSRGNQVSMDIEQLTEPGGFTMPPRSLLG